MTDLSVVVSTYERPDALDAVLWALSEESERGVEVVVADDGSGPETEAVVDGRKRELGGRLVHVRQPDEGFRLAAVRNRAAAVARGDYLLFVDGDCVPRRGLVAAVGRAARPGWFLGSRRVMLSEGLTARALEQRLPIHRWTLARWAVRERSEIPSLHALTPRDRRRPWRSGLPDFEPFGGGFGFFLGVARSDFEAVNGYDARFHGWGYEDHDIAVRLRRLGLRSGWAGPRSTVLHLWHPNLKAESDLATNVALLAETESADRVEAVEGLREVAEPQPRA